jgi:hypothetical protein
VYFSLTLNSSYFISTSSDVKQFFSTTTIVLSILNWLACYLQGLPSGIAGDAPVLLLQESSDEDEPPLAPEPEPESLCW